MRKFIHTGIPSAAAFLLVAACGGPVAPERPTWEADVYPILQGQCLHCHGGTAKETGNNIRFDFFDKEKCEDIMGSPQVSYSPSNILATVRAQGEKYGDDDSPQGKLFRPRMPPAPASLLEDWQVETIRNWVRRYADDKEASRGDRGKRNRLPSIRITSKLPDTVGSSLKVSYVVEDSDGDPVIGLLKLGDAVQNINAVGAGEVEFTDLPGDSGGELKLSADLCDGWEKRTVNNLGTVEKE